MGTVKLWPRVKANRTGWPAGPWDGEPDNLDWKFGPGLRKVSCCIRRHTTLGNLNGYVMIPPGHPWRTELPETVEVHGGITYGPTSDGIIGFDTGHYCDVHPTSMPVRMIFTGERAVYRDIAFVRAETEKLAQQLLDAWAGPIERAVDDEIARGE